MIMMMMMMSETKTERAEIDRAMDGYRVDKGARCCLPILRVLNWE